MKKQIITVSIMMFGIAVFAAPKINEKSRENYEDAMATLGSSAVEALIELCEGTQVSSVDVKNPRASILEDNGGMDLGPVRYNERTRVKVRKELVSLGGGTLSGYSSTGELVTIHNNEPTIYKNRYDVQHRGYDVEMTPKFEQGIKRMEEAARHKHPEACAEMGAFIFADVFKTKMGYSELKMIKYFKTAADGGSLNGKYMVAYCTYFGIGCTANRGRAKMYLKEWAKAKDEAGESVSSNKASWSCKVLGK